MPEPVIISDWRHGKSAITTGLSKLKETGSALDAVEFGIRAVEDDPLTESVGTGGVPNIEGVDELDASIMVGNTLRCGAVSGLTMTQNPISVARKVMELCPHVMLTGDGARRFARATGFPEYQPVTEAALKKWKVLRARLDDALNGKIKLEDYSRVLSAEDVAALRKGIELMVRTGQIKELGTVGTLCLDSSGMIVAGTSTSGLALRLPGRVADSSVIGAGNYADSSGASSCTGLGEIAIRHGLTRGVCDLIELGVPPTEACETALKNMLRRDKSVKVVLALIALDKQGRVGGATTKAEFSYQYQRLNEKEMTEVFPTPVSV
jgi:isoaspartyl peptidase/L-asparaginase-like protein (Ntn-hydrolase superfamily)